MKKRTFIKLSSTIMAGAALAPLIDIAQDNRIKNWAGNLTYSTSALQQVGSVEETRAFVRKYKKLKVLGTRHCFNNIADSKDQLLSLSRCNKIIDIDTVHHAVTVEAGVRYGELATWLNDRGYALHNLASLPHISVAGGCATATHGSGVHNGNLSSVVRSMEFVTAAGEVVTLSRERDGEKFAAAVVHLGGIGVITKITLAIEPTYQVRQYVYENLPIPQLQDHFDEIMSAAYSVSLFTDWRNHNINEIWIKSRMGEKTDWGHRPDLFGATAATRNLHPIRGIDPVNCTEQMGVPGAWHERLPHFRMGFMPSGGEELQSEYFIPRERSFEAIQAVGRLHDKISPHLLITEIRCIAADDLWMSPCYHQDSTTIHFTWKPDWPAVRQLLPLVEEALEPFHAKPHWAKLYTISHQRLLTLYPKLPAFQQLLRQYDPEGKFRNEYLNKVIFG
jgi:alditol oxidase